MRIDIDERRQIMELGDFSDLTSRYEFLFNDMSELGDVALQDANVWFGLPLAHGLKLAELDADLGEYFKTERGVLVLKAKPDNDMQLESGDVVLQVGDREVNSPADFMRALRDFEPGEEIEVAIKRERKNRTLTTVMPERQTRIFVPHADEVHTIKITTDTD